MTIDNHTTTVRAALTEVQFNPYRDLENYPIDESTVDALVGSFQEVGNFSTLPARRIDDGYEIAAGHHRLVALDRIGTTHVNLTVGDYSDDDMIEIMTVENSTQRGHNTAALLDSVSAITKRLAYLLLMHEPGDLSTIVERCFSSQKAASTARGQLLKGNGIGEDLILAYAPDGALNRREVREALSTLKSDGRLNTIIEEVKVGVEAELAEIEAAARAATKAAEKAAEDQRKAQERAEKAAEKARVEADEAKRKAAEAETKRLEEHQRAAEKMQQLAERHQQEEAARLEKQQKRKADVTEAATHKHDTTLHSGVGKYFANANQLSAFRKVCTEHADVLPVAMQDELAKQLIKDLGSDISGRAIREYVQNKAHSTRVRQRRMSKREKAALERQQAQNSFYKHMATIQRGVNLISVAVVKANELANSNQNLEMPAGAARLKRGVSVLIADLKKLEGVL